MYSLALTSWRPRASTVSSAVATPQKLAVERLGEQVAQRVLLGLREPVERGRRRRQARADLLAHPPALVGQDEQLHAAVAFVAASLHIAALLEPVGDPRDRRAVAAQQARDRAHGGRLVERVEREELRWLQAVLGLDVEHAVAVRREQLHEELPGLLGRLDARAGDRLCHNRQYTTTLTIVEVFNCCATLLVMSETNGIEVEGLVRVFKKGPRAVDGIDLEVAPGEIYGFLGPNGAGKSTTVLMLTTLLPPTAGTARVGGHDIVHEGAAVRRSIGAALQEAALDPFLTGREHMRLQAGLHGLDRAERERRGDELLARVGLSDAADRKVGGYSGGMKRRLDLGLALVHRPRILFLDEPTTGLDIQSRTALWGEVRRLSREDGVTVFLTTQYLEEADVLADRVGIIDHGHIVAEGTPAELKAQIGRSSIEVVPALEEDRERLSIVLERFGECTETRAGGVAAQFGNGDELADVVRALDGEGIRVAHLSVHEPSLDDVFLAKTGRSLEGAGGEEEEAEAGAAGMQETPA